MPRQLFTAADIRRISREQKSELVVLSSDDIVTPEARDIARELGIQFFIEDPAKQNIPPQPQLAALSSQALLPPLKMIFGGGVIMDPFGEGLASPGTNVRLKDVISSSDGSSMAAGFMALDQGEFPWTLTYDEIDIVLEGELVITRGNTSVHANPGDIIFIPKGSSITFGTPGKVRFVYVAFPANWNDQA